MCDIVDVHSCSPVAAVHEVLCKIARVHQLHGCPSAALIVLVRNCSRPFARLKASVLKEVGCQDQGGRPLASHCHQCEIKKPADDENNCACECDNGYNGADFQNETPPTSSMPPMLSMNANHWPVLFNAINLIHAAHALDPICTRSNCSTEAFSLPPFSSRSGNLRIGGIRPVSA